MTAEPIRPRFAKLVLVTPDGEIVGASPPFRVATPWWQEAEPEVKAARACDANRRMTSIRSWI